MLVRALGALAMVVFLSASPSALAAEPLTLAQAPPAAEQTDVTGDLPSGTWLLIVVGLGLAAYLSYRLGHKQETQGRRREGPMSRALSGQTTKREDR